MEKMKKIPIKNLYYMLCYAWNILSIKNDILLNDDDFGDAYNLLARILSHCIGKLIKFGFHKSYVEKEENLETLRGKINIQDHFKNVMMKQKKVSCIYDEYEKNDLFNKIIKYTMKTLISNKDVSNITKSQLRKYLIYFNDIEEEAPTKNIRQKLIFNRNNTIYKTIIRVCTMIYDNTIVSDEDGTNAFKDFFREEQMQKVFEMFLLNFYLINLDRKVYKVHAPKINWHLQDNSQDDWDGIFDVETNPGDRRTDIVVENNILKTQFIIDAKYYQKTFADKYMDPNGEGKVRTGHLNQVRGYVLDSEFDGKKYGALIYPMVNDELKKGRIFDIIGSPIIVKTVNLNVSWNEIENDLLEFVKKIEKRKKDH